MTDQVPDILARLQAHASSRPDEVFLQVMKDGRRETYSYREVVDQASRVASFLTSAGIRPGEAVGILMENHPVWGIAFLGIQWAGAVAVPLDTFHTPETLRRLMKHADCRFLVSSEGFLTQLAQIREDWPGAPPVLLKGRHAGSGYADWETELSRCTPSPAHLRPPDDPVTIIYTSGTTGDPKGVVLTGRNIYGNIAKALSLIEVTTTDHLLSILPLYHILSLGINLLVPAYRGCKLTFLDSLDPNTVIRTFSEQEITIFVCVPQFYYGLQRRVEAEIEKQSWLKRFLFRRLLATSHFARETFDLNLGKVFFGRIHRRFGPEFRLFAVGGARFDPTVESFLRDLGFQLIQAYGMTESGALITMITLEDYEVGSVGRALPAIDLRIDNPDADGVGEVIVRGPNVMTGYWRNPDATSQTIVDGWLRTGDSGYLSPKGFLYLTGRLKDVIVLSSGKNIYPEELEHHFQIRCPEIKEMCVVGVSDETSEGRREKLHAVIVPDFEYLKSRKIVNAADMIRYLLETHSQELPSFKRVRSFEIRRDPLPRTTTRKVKRFQVAKELGGQGPSAPSGAQESAEQETVPENPIDALVFTQIRQMKRAPRIDRGMNLELDLGFDSLERVELLSNLQDALQVHVPDESAAEILTVGELADALRARVGAEDSGETREAASSWQEILAKPLREDDSEQLRQVLAPKPVAEFLLYVAALVTHLLTKVLFRFRVHGLEKLPREYPFVICPNHLSYLDPFFVVCALPYPVIKRLFFLGYSDYFRDGVLGFLGRAIKVIPVDPDKQLRQALRLAAEGLKRRHILCVFPEGERSIDGELKPFRRGPAILASEFRLPAVPAALKGTFEVWPRGVSRMRFHPVSLCFGDPVTPAEGETYEEFNARLAAAVRKLQ
ncbi:MAG: hypothetical protein EHM61_18035 [Acidobacteria bacterium]|nr:MAG: hypothetical protein EHM61_18035 [Acidobacteriota bacterium]